MVDGDTNGFLPAVGTLLPNPLGQIDHRANFGEPNFNHFERNQWAAGWDARHEFSDDIAFELQYEVEPLSREVACHLWRLPGSG